MPVTGENLSIILIDTSNENDVCIDNVLIAYGYAKHVSEEQ